MSVTEGLFFKPNEELLASTTELFQGTIPEFESSHLQRFFRGIKKAGGEASEEFPRTPGIRFDWAYRPFFQGRNQLVYLPVNQKPGVVPLSAFYASVMGIALRDEKLDDNLPDADEEKVGKVVYGLANVARVMNQAMQGQAPWSL